MASHDPAVYSSLGFHHFGLHRHRRSGASRRRFLHRAVGAAGLAVTSSLWLPSLTYAADSSPRPIPGGFQPQGDRVRIGGTVGPFTVKTTIPSGQSASQTQSLGWARFLGPTAGDAISGWIAGA